MCVIVRRRGMIVYAYNPETKILNTVPRNGVDVRDTPKHLSGGADFLQHCCPHSVPGVGPGTTRRRTAGAPDSSLPT